MGVDCKMMINNAAFNLDRWYCFSEIFDNGKKYNRKVAIAILESSEVDEDFEDKKDYVKSWRDIALGIIKYSGFDSGIRFYSDSHYYEVVDRSDYPTPPEQKEGADG